MKILKFLTLFSKKNKKNSSKPVISSNGNEYTKLPHYASLNYMIPNSQLYNNVTGQKIASMLATQKFAPNFPNFPIFTKSAQISDAEVTSVLNSSLATLENNHYPVVNTISTTGISGGSVWMGLTDNSNDNSFAQGTSSTTTNYNNSTYGYPNLIDVFNKNDMKSPLVDIETLKNKLKKISTENAEVLLNEINKMYLELDSLKKIALEEMADIKHKEENEKNGAAISQLEL